MNQTQEAKKINQIITNDGLRMKQESGVATTDGTEDNANVRVDTPEPIEEKTV